jgi:carboxyl-terminal processing protease
MNENEIWKDQNKFNDENGKNSKSNKLKWILITVVLLLFTNLITAFFLSKGFFQNNKISKEISNNVTLSKKIDSYDIKKYKKLFVVRDKLYKYYDGNINDDQLIIGAIEGMTDKLYEQYDEDIDIDKRILLEGAVKGVIAPFNGENSIKVDIDLLLVSALEGIMDKFKEQYDKQIDEGILIEGAIKGMTASLNDPYTVFMNEKELGYLMEETEGSYVGIGIQVGITIEDEIVVIAPFEDSPAKKAGLLPGDVIKKVDGIEVAGSELNKAVSMMRGMEGKQVTLTILRKGKSPFDVNITRAEIPLITVRGEMLDDEIGYIFITQFNEHTGKDFENKLTELQKNGAKSLILDLRGNPGGTVTACVDVASNFIPKGDNIVYTIDKYENKKVYKSKGGNALKLPIVVLTDQGTASASEILSGALRDYNRATLVGKKTFGKGIVQTILYRKIEGFGDGTALKVTISKYYTPNGENIHKKGIAPDIEIEYPMELREQIYSREKDPQFQEALKVIEEKVGSN